MVSVVSSTQKKRRLKCFDDSDKIVTNDDDQIVDNHLHFCCFLGVFFFNVIALYLGEVSCYVFFNTLFSSLSFCGSFIFLQTFIPLNFGQCFLCVPLLFCDGGGQEHLALFFLRFLLRHKQNK